MTAHSTPRHLKDGILRVEVFPKSTSESDSPLMLNRISSWRLFNLGFGLQEPVPGPRVEVT
jgi:hypothetical protein